MLFQQCILPASRRIALAVLARGYLFMRRSQTSENPLPPATRERRRSKYYLLYVPVIFILSAFLFWENVFEPRPVWSDSEGYYMYLPGVFILKDVHSIPPGSVLPQYNDRGEHVLKYTCGVAILELPFFLAAKWYCQWNRRAWQDYFNAQYMQAMTISGMAYGLIGLLFLASALRQRFSEVVTLWTVLSVFLGTNLFYYATKSMTMSHVYSFFLFAVVIWLTPRLYAKPDIGKSIVIGLATGLAILIRPTNVLILLFVAFFDIYTIPAFYERLRFFMRHRSKLIAAAVAGAMVYVPQLWYWYEMTGRIVRYSYTNEGFIYWNSPKIGAVLFDSQNGLFMYSPLTLLMMAGTVIGVLRQKCQGPAIAIIICLATYGFASWWAWWFGGAFGHRNYVEYYALLAIPLAGLYHAFFRSRRIPFKVLVIIITASLMAYSVRMAQLYRSLPGPWDGADWRWNMDKMSWIWSHLLVCG